MLVLRPHRKTVLDRDTAMLFVVTLVLHCSSAGLTEGESAERTMTRCCRVRSLQIRKWMTAAAQLPEAVFAVAYGMARTPGSAALAYSGRKICFGRKTFGEFGQRFRHLDGDLPEGLSLCEQASLRRVCSTIPGPGPTRSRCAAHHRYALPGSSAIPCCCHESLCCLT